MVAAWMVLGPVVAVVAFAWAPIKTELPLALSTPEPVEVHVDRLCGVRNDFVVDEAIRGGVVGLDRGARLVVTHFSERHSDGDGCAGVQVKSSQFGFGGGGHDIFDNLGDV